MGKKRVEDYKSQEAQEIVEATAEVTEEPKKEEKLKQMTVKRVFTRDIVLYTGDNKSKIVKKEYYNEDGTVRRTKEVDVTKIHEPVGEGREKTFQNFANGLQYLEFIVAHRNYKKV